MNVWCTGMQMKYCGWPPTKLLNRAKVSKCA